MTSSEKSKVLGHSVLLNDVYYASEIEEVEAVALCYDCIMCLSFFPLEICSVAYCDVVCIDFCFVFVSFRCVWLMTISLL